jgi:hypothetical protein
MRDHRVFEYEVVPVVHPDAQSDPWTALRTELDQRGRRGFRVVAVVEAPGGGAIIMERDVDPDSARSPSVSQAAEDITWESSR